ncbi:Folliculin [Geodia barretti]|uniref:Folliculin n=1 Tax=Geodia barretti TaxID=519541 RepID=A0AA35T9T7_GEOBA|nr:Folliculin [Geodia barretti]
MVFSHQSCDYVPYIAIAPNLSVSSTSLNCEVCPGREGPIAFGEDGSSHVLSYTFKIKDSQARGFSRLYSLVVVMMDRVFLINSWPFLVKHFRALIDDLQGKAECVYSRETEESKQHTSRSLRSSVSSTHGLDHLRRIRANETGRSLVELTGDGGIFRHLHRYFVFLLKAGGLRITECVLEGPPRVVADPESSGEQPGPAPSTPEALERPLSAADFRVVEEEGVCVLGSLQQVFHLMDKASFQYLATHILKGNQVIVRGNSVSLVTSLINILKNIVPEKCCQIVPFSKSYKEPFVCNFLGLSSSAEVPKHVTSSDLHVVVEIFHLGAAGRVVGGVWAGLRLGEGEGRGREDGNPCSGYRLVVVQSNSKTSEAKASVFLTRLVTLLSSEVLSDATISGGLSALKEEWMNKVKVLYKFSQMGHLEMPQKNERLTKLLHEILYVGYEDLPILQYWRAALSKEYKTHLMQAART